MSISAHQTSSFGDIDLFVSNRAYPDTQNFLYQDTSTNTHLSIQIEDVEAGTWYIGLYGYWTADYDITVLLQSR